MCHCLVLPCLCVLVLVFTLLFSTSPNLSPSTPPHNAEGGNGLVCILPARHSSQIASVCVFDSRTIPVTSCHSDSSRASVKTIAVHSLGERGAVCRDSEAGEMCSVVLTDWGVEQRPAVVCEVHACRRDGDSEIAMFGEEGHMRSGPVSAFQWTSASSWSSERRSSAG